MSLLDPPDTQVTKLDEKEMDGSTLVYSKAIAVSIRMRFVSSGLDLGLIDKPQLFVQNYRMGLRPHIPLSVLESQSRHGSFADVAGARHRQLSAASSPSP